MTVREQIQAEIDRLDSAQLDELYEVVKMFARSPESLAEVAARMIEAHEEQEQAITELFDRIRALQQEAQAAVSSSPPPGATLIDKLSNISIDGPEDFSSNHDRYVLGHNGG